MNLFVDFFKFFKCRLFIKDSKIYRKRFVNNEALKKQITE